MRISILQVNHRPENPEGILSSALRLIRRAREENAELACLPEIWLPEEFCLTRKGLLDELRGAAQEQGLYLLTGALPEKTNGKKEIVSHLISPEARLLGSQSKIHLFRSQQDRYQAAKSLKPIKTPLGTLGILVCYDDVFPEPARRLALEGSDVLLIPSRIRREGVRPWQLYLQVRALENRIPVIAPNITGLPVYNGHSLAVGLDHDVKRDIVYPQLSEASARQQVLTVDVDLAQSKKLREDRLSERRPELY